MFLNFIYQNSDNGYYRTPSDTNIRSDRVPHGASVAGPHHERTGDRQVHRGLQPILEGMLA